MSLLWSKVTADFPLPRGHCLNSCVWIVLWEGAWCAVGTYAGKGMGRICAFLSVTPCHVDGAFCDLSLPSQHPKRISPVRPGPLALSMCCCSLGGRWVSMYLTVFGGLGPPWGQGTSVTHNHERNNHTSHLFEASCVPGPLPGPFFC